MFSELKTRRAAILFQKPHSKLPDAMSEWKISDADAFHDNLSMWCPNVTNVAAMMFTEPMRGVKQHLADCTHQHVGVAGNCLSDAELCKEIQEEYLRRGYTVVIMDDSGCISLVEPSVDDDVRIFWD